MEEQNKETNIKSTIEAVTGLVKAVPVYEDALQPAAKQVGKTLETATKAVNMALAPLKAIVWGYEMIEEWLTKRVSEKLNDVPVENIVTPSPQIAGPTVEALRYVANDEELRELYANLLATSMNSERLHTAHPGYVEIIKNMSTDEAILLKDFVIQNSYPTIDITEHLSNTGYHVCYINFTHWHYSNQLKNPDLIPIYIDNLCRLGVTEQPFGLSMTNAEAYQELVKHSMLEDIREGVARRGNRIEYIKRSLRLTSFGGCFVNNIVQDA